MLSSPILTPFLSLEQSTLHLHSNKIPLHSSKPLSAILTPLPLPVNFLNRSRCRNINSMTCASSPRFSPDASIFFFFFFHFLSLASPSTYIFLSALTFISLLLHFSHHNVKLLHPTNLSLDSPPFQFSSCWKFLCEQQMGREWG